MKEEKDDEKDQIPLVEEPPSFTKEQDITVEPLCSEEDDKEAFKVSPIPDTYYVPQQQIELHSILVTPVGVVQAQEDKVKIVFS